jgi:hypothetical protein
VLLVCTVDSEIALSGKPFGIEHMYIYFLLRITYNTTSQIIDRPSWDTLYAHYSKSYFKKAQYYILEANLV